MIRVHFHVHFENSGAVECDTLIIVAIYEASVTVTTKE